MQTSAVSRFALVALTAAALGCSSNPTTTNTTSGSDAASDSSGGDAATGGDTATTSDTTTSSDTAAGGDVSDTATADTAAGGSDSTSGDSAQDSGGGDVGGGDSSASDASGGTPVPLEQFTAKIFEAMCAAMVNCGGHTFATVEGCLGFVTSQLDGEEGPDEMVALAKAGKLTYDAVAAGKCLALYSNCGIVSSGKAPGSCADVFVGSLANGAACDQDETCKSAYCKKSDMLDASCPGVCTAKAKAGGACQEGDGCEGDLLCIAEVCAAPGGAVGAACAGKSCGVGLYCSSTGASNVCAAKLDAGKSCEESDACKDGLFCGMNAAGDGATCQVQAKVGEACGGLGSGSGGSGGFGSDAFGAPIGPCAGNAICAAPGPGKPSVCVTVAKVGAACTSNAQCGGMDVTCAGLTDSKPGTCQALPGKEQPCSQPDFTKGQLFTCQLPLVCDPKTSKCSDPPSAGQSCLLFCAAGLTCSGGTCLAKATEGQPCGNVSCASGLSCDGQKCVKPMCK